MKYFSGSILCLSRAHMWGAGVLLLGLLLAQAPAYAAGQEDEGSAPQTYLEAPEGAPELAEPPEKDQQERVAELRARVDAIIAQYRIGAEAGDPTSMYILAHGLLLLGRSQEGIRWMEKAASVREPRALAAMGQFHHYGDFGVEQSYELAADLYRAAADQDDPDGLFGLAFLYELGRGVEWDAEKAAVLYARAAEMGHGLSQLTLARMHILGQISHPDYVASYKWLKILTEQADIDARLKRRANIYLSRVKDVMRPGQVVEGEAAARAWLQRTKPPARKPQDLVIP